MTITYRRHAYYHETDQMGVIHHANYVKWLEESRIHFLNEIGLSYKKMEDDGIISPITAINVEYKNPVHFDEDVDIEAGILEYTGVKLTIGYTLRVGDKVVCKAESKHCFIKDGSIISLKRDYKEFHEVLMKAKEE